MDTRSKILKPRGAPPADAPRPLAVVTGYFDILRVEHARELALVRSRTGGGTVMVLVLPMWGELLSISARAQMAAALRMVDYVGIVENRDVDRLIEGFEAELVVHLESAEARLRTQLREHVERRKS